VRGKRCLGQDSHQWVWIVHLTTHAECVYLD